MKTIQQYFQKIKTYALAHKIISVVVIVVLLGGAWYVFASGGNTAQTRYIMGAVSQGTIISTVSESGQVSANDDLNITPQVSGQIIKISVTPGKQVKAGDPIATIDPTTADQQIESDKESLQSAQLALQKLQEPAQQATLTQQQDAVTSAQSSLATDYQNSRTDITNTYLDLPNIVTSVQDAVIGTETNKSGQWNVDYYENQTQPFASSAQQYRNNAYNGYLNALNAYDKAFADYQAMDLATASSSDVQNMLTETNSATQLVNAAAQSMNSFVQFYETTVEGQGNTPISLANTEITNLSSDITKLNSDATNLQNDSNSITSDSEGVTEKQQTLQQTQAGADPLDVQSSELSVEKAQQALSQDESNLSKYYITAPFDGTIASVPVNTYDQASSGTTLATLITNAQYADLSVNEVDAAKIQLGQKATLTFDAITDLTLTGTVVEVNPVGTVSQGVVSYDVKISFDTQDPRVKTGMTVNANIQTDIAQNTLEVPSSAVKTQGSTSYVLAFTPALASSTVAAAGTAGVVTDQTPQMIPVQTGISDSSNVQILSGLQLGQQIVVRTASGSATVSAASTATTRTTGAGGGFGGGATRAGAGGGAIRIGG